MSPFSGLLQVGGFPFAFPVNQPNGDFEIHIPICCFLVASLDSLPESSDFNLLGNAILLANKLHCSWDVVSFCSVRFLAGSLHKNKLCTTRPRVGKHMCRLLSTILRHFSKPSQVFRPQLLGLYSYRMLRRKHRCPLISLVRASHEQSSSPELQLRCSRPSGVCLEARTTRASRVKRAQRQAPAAFALPACFQRHGGAACHG